MYVVSEEKDISAASVISGAASVGPLEPREGHSAAPGQSDPNEPVIGHMADYRTLLAYVAPAAGLRGAAE